MVGGDGLTYTSMTMTGNDAQLIQQLQWTAQDVARCFHVPGHKIGLDTGARTANSSAIYESMYYSDCLQAYLEAIELLLDDAFYVPDGAGLRFDTKGLMRMDEGAQHAANAQAVGAGYMSPNEARATVHLPPVEGGDTPYLQQQNFSLAALAKRDKDNPFSTPAAGANGASASSPDDEQNPNDTADQQEADEGDNGSE
jgi:phage portal protein BeeE